MHDKNGVEIHKKDFVMVDKWDGERQVKTIVLVTALTPGSDTCNVMCASIQEWSGVQLQYENAKDVEIVLKYDGRLPFEKEEGTALG